MDLELIVFLQATEAQTEYEIACVHGITSLHSVVTYYSLQTCMHFLFIPFHFVLKQIKLIVNIVMLPYKPNSTSIKTYLNIFQTFKISFLLTVDCLNVFI